MSEVSTKVVNATDETFDSIVKSAEGKVVLVDFWSTTCMPCKALAPVLDEISLQRSDVVIVKVNMEDGPKLFQKNAIRGVPFLQLIVDGEVEAQVAGAMNKDQLNDWIDSNT